MEAPLDSPPAYTREDATFAQVALGLDKSIELGPDFKDALAAFRIFLTSQENDRLSRDQLRLLKSKAVHVLEECAKYKNAGGDLSLVLPVLTEILTGVSGELEKGPKWEQAIEDPSAIRELQSTIENAFDKLEAQMRRMAKGEGAESTMYKNELEKARENDRKKIEELEAVIRQLQSSTDQSPNEVLQNSMEENLKIIRDPSPYVGQKRIDARKALALIAELTGKTLPPKTILDQDFVTIGTHAINQGSSYDVFLGEYFTGEKIAIKVLRHRVDKETAKRTHERFARLTENWSALRHDSILPFYGVGVMQSPVSSTEYQLYLVSPYLKNQDVKRYIRTYPTVAGHARSRMALDIARGLKYMHGAPEIDGKGMVHSALNIYNVLVKDSGRAVISGFGHAKVIKDFQASFTGDNSEYRYMGPEILDDAVLTFGSDIWSWAMTSLEILTDEPPFGQKTRGTKIIQMIGTNKRPERANHPKIEEYEHSDEIWRLFEDCWKRQPEERPSAREVVQRFKSLVVHELGKKSDTTIQKPPPPTYPRTEYGRSDPPVQQVVRPHELGKSTPSVAQGHPPSSGTGGSSGGAQDGRANKPVVPGSTPPPGSP
ncbi:RGS domain-containing serine/threonine-protein kinase A OS=Dictyostelium discoideum GN=rckA PE=1 SV=1 [Rhizoctonia solani AG-1 IB]|uniref:RGS domain-containing serine/threonine-protein kinase A n=1 Tax=Thanatephorus cucumeris (strain AG1-IB / isolate 7/3/14) TaxID=1108050 RepID=A0A0B7FB75_THACB|nr:RGS domain-containing serine/threonine-protein kinase A OS=Dictyostelium discoideum GN=rckA PE=1 SV=1 [Rhizoctonia solani AG-1 IB]